MSRSENKTENYTIVNGVVLTEKAVCFLNKLQELDNQLISYIREDLSDSISMLIDFLDLIDESERDRDIEYEHLIMQKIKFLNTFNKQMKDLMKP